MSEIDPQPGQIWKKAGPSDALKIVSVHFDEDKLPGISVKISYINARFKMAWRRKTSFIPVSRKRFGAFMRETGRSLLPNAWAMRRRFGRPHQRKVGHCFS